MKAWPLLIGIIVILAIFCSPVLAMSKSELISQYQTEKPTISPPPKEKFSMTSSPLDIPNWVLKYSYPSLRTAWQCHGGLSYIYEPCDFCETIHFTLPDGTVV